MRTATLAMLTALAVLPAARADTAVLAFTTYIYDKPSKASDVLGELRMGETVSVLSCKDSWCDVQRDGGVGWVEQALLEPHDARVVAEPNPVCASGEHAIYGGWRTETVCTAKVTK